ncbi:MAG TPA: polysaccharide biosynthesis/export family protein [Candidatus Acidoferrum sp.]|nr:polysaccharide biosynthesis/export family protein [Candidatus Acidoferrum sp.]
MKSTIPMILAACLIVSVAQARSESPTAQDKKEEAKGSKGQATPAAVQTAAQEPAYKIGPQDVLKIDVWREEQLTRVVPVRPDGKVTLPLLNDVQAAGLTPMELAGVISEGLKKYINNPQVTVTITEINSRRIYVTGEVARAGAFPLLPNMTVLQALTSAGGSTQFAKIRNIYVLRTEGGKQVKHPFNYKDVINGKKPEDNIQLQAGDVIVVP